MVFAGLPQRLAPSGASLGGTCLLLVSVLGFVVAHCTPRSAEWSRRRPVLAGLEDRAFRSLLDAALTLERLRGWKVGIRSYQEPWIDTTSAFGEAMITAVWAQLEPPSSGSA